MHLIKQHVDHEVHPDKRAIGNEVDLVGRLVPVEHQSKYLKVVLFAKSLESLADKDGGLVDTLLRGFDDETISTHGCA